MAVAAMMSPDDNDKLNEILKRLQESNEMTGQLLNNLARTTVGMSDSITTMQGDMSDVKDRVTALEDDQFLKPWQAANVQEAAKARVNDLLGLVWVDGNVIDECMDDYVKYYKKFISCLHRNAKRAGLEGRKYYETPRKNYQMLIEFIAEWVPLRGVAGQKEYYDKLVARKELAKQQAELCV